jgi:parvulin-like peptidyl-prolyl isomerase
MRLEAESTAKGYLLDLDRGTSFDKLAKKTAAKATVPNYLNTWVSLADLPNHWSGQVYDLKMGSYSNLLVDTDGYYILKLRNKTDAANQELKRNITEEKARQQYQLWLKDLLESAIIEKFII